jgi:hypothetical protein
MGTPGDIAHAVSFLASEGAGFITGQRIVIDGGRKPRQLTAVTVHLIPLVTLRTLDQTMHVI